MDIGEPERIVNVPIPAPVPDVMPDSPAPSEPARAPEKKEPVPV